MIRITADEIASIVNGKIIGDGSVVISGIKGIEESGTNDLTFLSDIKYLKYLDDSSAGVILINNNFDYSPKPEQTIILVDNAYTSVVKILNLFDKKINVYDSGVHPTAVIDDTAKISSNSLISAGCVIGKNVTIGDNVKILPNSVIYDNVTIGDDTLIHANTVIGKNCIIGKRCLIQAGAVIGSEGFGFIEHKDGSYTRIPQLGNVVMEDDVEIGSNTTIDRAMVGSTYIEKGVKLDNLIQIGHNSHIGENSAFAAQVGISGSVRIGSRCRFGGQVGVAGHIDINDEVILMAQSGVAKSIEQPGMYFGSPIKERVHAFKIEAALRQLPNALRELNKIKKELYNK